MHSANSSPPTVDLANRKVSLASPRLTLSARGLILIGFPLLCQLGFATTLGAALVHVQSEMLAQTESRQLISKATKLSGDCVRFAFTFSGQLEGEAGIARKTREFAVIDDEIKTILDLASQKQGFQAVDRFKQATTELQLFFSDWQNEQKAGTNWMAARPRIDAEAKVRIKAFALALDALLTEEESHYRENNKEKTAAKEAIKTLFIFAAAFSLLSTVALAYVYAVLVSGPIARLSENSTLLSERKTLLPALKSGDEFEALDRMLHQVSTALDEAARAEAALVEHAQDLLCALDQSANFLSVNAYAQTMLGYGPDELTGESLRKLTTEAAFVEFSRSLKQALSATSKEGSPQMLSLDLPLKHRDGSMRDSKWSCYWSQNERSLFCVVNDTTEQRRIELLKADFTEMLTNDLRKPLEDIQAAISRITQSKEPLSEATSKKLSTMTKSLQKLIFLVNDLLDKQRLSAGKLVLKVEPIAAQVLLEEAIEMVQGLALAKHIKLVLKPLNESSSGTTYGDKQKLTEVLVNLLGNAIKFTPANSMVTVGAARRGTRLEISVTDSGPGVPPEMQETIFQAFKQMADAPTIKASTSGSNSGIAAKSPQSDTLSTGQGAGTGVGLGLAICKQIIEAHGGRIGVRVSSDQAKPGSTFWFSLPEHRNKP